MRQQREEVGALIVFISEHIDAKLTSSPPCETIYQTLPLERAWDTLKGCIER